MLPKCHFSDFHVSRLWWQQQEGHPWLIACSENGVFWVSRNPDWECGGVKASAMGMDLKYRSTVGSAMTMTLKHCCFLLGNRWKKNRWSRKNGPGFCNRQFGFWQLGSEGQFPLSICFNVKNGRKSVFSILWTFVYALTQMSQIFHS